MKINMVKVFGIVAVAGVVFFSGCRQKSDSPGVGERTGAALDTATENTVEGAKAMATATKEVADKVVDKTGEALERAGEDMRKPKAPVTAEE